MREYEPIRLDDRFIREVAKIATDLMLEGAISIVPQVDNISEMTTTLSETLSDTELETIVTIDIEELIDLEQLVSSELGLADPIGQLKKTISDFINSATSFISEKVGTFIDELWSKIEAKLGAVPNILDDIASKLLGVGNAITGFINAILKFPEWFPNWFREHIAQPIVDALGTLASKLWELLPDWLKNALTGIWDAIKKIPDYVKSIPDWIEKVKNAIDTAINYLKRFFEDPVGTLKNALGWLAERLWNLLPDWLKNTLIKIRESFEKMIEYIKNFFKDPIGALKEAFGWLAERIWNLLPESFKNFIERARELLDNLWDSVVNFASWMYEQLKLFAKDPWGYIKNLFVTVGSNLWNFLKERVFPAVIDVGKAILEGVSELASTILQTNRRGIKTLRYRI